jgi:hypothetical protein
MKKVILTCPNCKGGRNRISTLASNPPQYEYECCRCDWCLRYFDRIDSKKDITQDELDTKYAEKLRGCEKMEERALRPGQKVIVREDLRVKNIYEMANDELAFDTVTAEMMTFCGKTVTIADNGNSGKYNILEDNSQNCWTDEMFQTEKSSEAL